jgi:flavodoxin I
MKIGVIYESTRGRTKVMAEAICDGVKAAGKECEIVDAQNFDGISNFCAIAVGSSTRMKRVLPMVKRILAELAPLNGLPVASFGSYGWSGEAPDEIIHRLLELGGTQVVDHPIKAKDYPGEENLEECRNLGKQLSELCK